MQKVIKIKTFTDIDSYIAEQLPDVRNKLMQIRQTIKTSAPEAEELISYNMPAFKYHGILVYFAGYKNHIGFYALPSGQKAFEKELSIYKQGKGSVQFPLDKPMPLALIKKMVKFRVKENLLKEKVNKTKRSLPLKDKN
jgi:uncharacterized protein YdhG (YjbR/CyaY superfamily)